MSVGSVLGIQCRSYAYVRLPGVAAFVLLLAACGGGEAPPAEPAAEPQAVTPPPAAATRVFFAQPQDGATVKSPVQFEFGSEGITIAAVPPGTVEQPRPGMGHHHLGVDVDCLPTGREIPRGQPSWIHFGDGKNVIDMQLTPGPHRFALQLGDDQHRAIEGLCSTISITVAQ
jgi:hypothetical protein